MSWWLIVWVVGAVGVGVAAKSRNRVGFAWFLLSMLISPLLAGLLLALLGRDNSATAAATAAPQRHCPQCRELVRSDARLCKHCRSKIEPIS
jgi:hypothetical protein